jgi:hypothetical protein
MVVVAIAAVSIFSSLEEIPKSPSATTVLGKEKLCLCLDRWCSGDGGGCCCCCCCIGDRGGSGDGYRGGTMVSIALMAITVVNPRFPTLRFFDPYLYTQPISHPPSSHCKGRSFCKSTSLSNPTYEQVRMRMASANGSLVVPMSSFTRSLRRGWRSRWSSALPERCKRRARKKRKHSGVS